MMKKKLLTMILLAFTLVCLNAVISYGSISATSATINSGENVTISVSSAELLGAYAIQVTDNGGLTFVSSTAPAGFAANGTKISGASVTGVTSLGSFTFKAPNVTKDSTYYVKITSSGTEGPAPTYATVNPSTATATITVKAPVQPSPEPAPTFSDVNQTVYATTQVNIRSSYSTSSSKIGSLQKGQSVTRTGIGSNGWSRVSYNGQTGYIDSSYLTTTKPVEPSVAPSANPEETKSNDATLKSLSITGIDFTPAFDPSVTSYIATIGEDITEVEVIAQPTNEKAKVEITGNSNLQDGENTVTIVVTAEDGTVTNYEIKLIKGENSIPLKAFNIQGIKENDETIIIELGEPTITDNVVEYTITLNEYLKAINILGTINEKILNIGTIDYGIQYEGLGKFDLVVGENKYTVKLILEAQEGEEAKTIEYRLTINNPAKVVLANEKQDINYSLIIIIAIIAILTVLAIIFAILYYKKQNALEYAKPDYSFLRDDENIQNKEEEREQAKKDKNNIEEENIISESDNNIRENNTPESNMPEDNIQDNNDDDSFDGRRKGGKHF